MVLSIFFHIIIRFLYISLYIAGMVNVSVSKEEWSTLSCEKNQLFELAKSSIRFHSPVNSLTCNVRVLCRKLATLTTP